MVPPHSPMPNGRQTLPAKASLPTRLQVAQEELETFLDQVVPLVPARQWVLSFPIPLRILFAAHPELLTPPLRIVFRIRSACPCTSAMR